MCVEYMWVVVVVEYADWGRWVWMVSYLCECVPCLRWVGYSSSFAQDAPNLHRDSYKRMNTATCTQ